MAQSVTLRIMVDGPEPLDDAQRDQLTADLEDFLRQSGLEADELRRETLRPDTMAVGELLVLALPFAEPIIKAFSETLRAWLDSRRVTVTITTQDGRNISVSGPDADRIAVELAASRSR